MKSWIFIVCCLFAANANAQYSYQVCRDGNCRVQSSAVNPASGGYSVAPGETIVAINGQPVNSAVYQTYQAAPVVVMQAAPRVVYRQYYQYSAPRPYVRSWTGPFGVTHTRTIWR